SGGTVLNISGSGFTGGASVTLGGVPCTGIVFVSSSSLQVTAPVSSRVGPVDLVVSCSGGTGTLAGGYFYEGVLPNVDVIRVATGGGNVSQTTPRCVVEPTGAIDCVWADNRNSGGPTDIYFSRSTDNGVTWLSSVRLNDDAAGTHYHVTPAISVEPGGAIDCVWTDYRGAWEDIYFTRSTDGGVTWSVNTSIPNPTFKARLTPAIAVEP